jgi:hypothetical protein
MTLADDARDEAVARVEAAADVAWWAEAKRALWTTIQRSGEFTTDDIECSRPREPRAWGPVLLAAARAGLIVKTGRMRKSNQVVCHAREKAVSRVVPR